MSVFGKEEKVSWHWLAVSAVLLCATLYWLGGTVFQAVTTGSVTVNSTVRGGPRSTVYWLHGWAYLLGQVFDFLGACSALLAALGRPAFVLPPLVLIPAGAALVLFSGYLSSLRETVFLLGFLLFIYSAFWVKRKFGDRYAWVFSAAVIGLFIYANA